ncbi:kinesin-like protein KIN-UA isoform X2 [Amborella trichopoda]|uniref:kinesin-like protein KIN-UA isoform X2 n=1 Tax=Amborella trichopoda TaxID=13333 RepID=UPI0009BFA5F6|nr:kinesin-like protein KIN-UA isoform X2 [Amborella trichopoda]|eukprot:XP_020522021.1 kinesin-like protein KIN-UA isoform X2 [Amborella trichopoda]
MSRSTLRGERSSSYATAPTKNSVRSLSPAAPRSKALPSARPAHRAHPLIEDDDSVHGRVRVAVRLRPRNAEDLASDADYADCIELQPELKRLRLRKNNWSSESFKFDDVFTESASQKRVYEVVARPVVESVLNGYNGTVMAYGQTGTGKTYTVGRLGKEDPSERGIMVRSLEDILASTSELDSASVSYLQLYMESIQDLLVPEKNNIPIVEDPRTGEVSLPGVEKVKIRDLDHFLEVIQIGEANRHTTFTKLNTESSRSHAILMVYIQKAAKLKDEDAYAPFESSTSEPRINGRDVPLVTKSKLLIVDLAGSERIGKSGSEGHSLEEAKSINLSLTSLGKCINALAENSPHVPTRDSKLTRLLRDSFGGSARTSLVVTIGPSSRHHSETSSTIMFGQRAMKVENMIKLKEEFDYESHSRNLEHRLDHLITEIERRDSYVKEMELKLKRCQDSLEDAGKRLSACAGSVSNERHDYEMQIRNLMAELNLEKERKNNVEEEVSDLRCRLDDSVQLELEVSTYQKVLADTTQMYEQKISELIEQLDEERKISQGAKSELEQLKNKINDQKKLDQFEEQGELIELRKQVKELYGHHEYATSELQSLQRENEELSNGKLKLIEELNTLRQKLKDEEIERKKVEVEFLKIKRVSDTNIDLLEKTQIPEKLDRVALGEDKSLSFLMSNQVKGSMSGQRTTISKIFEEVGLPNVLALLKSEELDVQIHAVKVVANLAAEDFNQEKIVEEGGLDALLMLLESSENETILRVASGAIANLAMTETNQGLIISKGGAQLLSAIAYRATDPQTFRMVAGAIANLCGNERLHTMLKEANAIQALLEMARSGQSDVLSQVARGIANFAKCESRGIAQGHRKGQSLLIEDGALPWIVSHTTSSQLSVRRHMELALCHLAQHEANTRDLISSGGLKELIRLSHESTRDDIRNLAKRILTISPAFRSEIQRSC